MLQCFAKAEQAPVDNHLLCGGKQGEMEQMALVFILPRMLSLNKERSAECQALWERRGKLKPSCTTLLIREKAIVVCVCAPIPEWQACSASFINASSSGMDKQSGSFMTSLARALLLSSLTNSFSCRDATLMRNNSVVPANNQEKNTVALIPLNSSNLEIQLPVTFTLRGIGISLRRKGSDWMYPEETAGSYRPCVYAENDYSSLIM